MPVAIESFECHESDGTPVSVKAGVTWIHDPGHELLRRYPDKFANRIGGPPLGNAAPDLYRAGQKRRTAWPAATDWLKPEPKPAPKRPTARPDPDDFDTRKTACHEGGHAAAAHVFGWEVTDAEIHRNGGGHCGILRPEHRDRSRCHREYAVICYAAHAHAGYSATDSYRVDDSEAAKAVANLTNDLTRRRILRDALKQQAKELAATGRFKWLARAVEEALLECGRLDATELGPLLRGASLEYRRLA